MYGYIRTLNPKMFHMLVIIPYMERFGAGMLLPLWHAAVRVVCALWSGHAGALGVPLQGVGGGCCLLSEWCVQFGAGMLVALRVLLQRASNHAFGAGMLVSDACGRCCLRVLSSEPTGAAAARRVHNVPNSFCKGAGERYCCALLLQGAAVGVACPLWPLVPLQGAATRCCS